MTLGLLRRNSRKWFRTILASATVAGLVAVPVAALAESHPADADFGYAYNAETQELGFWFGPSDAEVECVWTDPSADEPTTEATEEPTTEEPATEATEESEIECMLVDVVGPNGQVNHGTVVSSFVHTLKDLEELIGYDGPRGRIISQIARTDFGKGDVVDLEGFELEGDDDKRHGPPAFVLEKKAARGSNGHGKNG